jgi:Tol biopolymer transport system component
MNIDGTEKKKLTNTSIPTMGYFLPMWSPDGTKFLYEKYEKVGEYYRIELFTMKPDGTSIEKISPAPQFVGRRNVIDLLYDNDGAWSPDGKFIALSSNRHAIKAGSNFDLEVYVIDLQTYKINQLTNGYGYSENPSWSPDGSEIAFMSDRDGDWDIYIMNIDGSGVKQLTKNRNSDRFPRWSPDGKKLIFHTDRDENIELYMIDVESLEETRITTNPATDATATFSPDGQWIVFTSDRDGDNDLYIMRIDGSEIRQITDNTSVEDWDGAWSP